MKRLWTLGIVLALLAVATPAALAAATELEPTVDGGKTFTVEYDTGSTANAGAQYVLLIVASGTSLESLTVDSILYIDQAAAAGNGKVSFGPLQLKRYVNADVYIGGASLGTPAKPYYIEVDGVEVSGTFSVPGTAPTVQLGSGSFGEFVSAYTADISTNRFTFSAVAPGAYTLKISKPGYLSYFKTVEIEGPVDTLLTGYALPGGDLDGDGAIQLSDLTALLADYGKSISFLNPLTDLDGDGTTQLSDLSRLLSGYNKSSTSISDVTE